MHLSRQIKMSSPNLNNLIIVGCILCYSSVIILGLDSSITSETAFPYICTAKAWVLMAGFTLSFGSMFSKTWRVHSIFTNVQLNKKVRIKFNARLKNHDSFAGYEGFTTFSRGGSSSVHGHNHNDNLATGGSFLSRSSKPETICNWN